MKNEVREWNGIKKKERRNEGKGKKWRRSEQKEGRVEKGSE